MTIRPPRQPAAPISRGPRTPRVKGGSAGAHTRAEQTTRPGRRWPHKAVIVVAGPPATTGQAERLLADSLRALGIEPICLGHEQSAQRIAAVVAEERADAVELCLAGGGGVLLLRELLRELIEIGRRDTRIVVHRVGSLLAGSTA